MSGAPQRVGDHELAFFFQTNEPIPARPLLTFIWEVERIALTQRHLGPHALVEITEIVTGTKLVRLTFNQKLTVAGLIGTYAGLAVAVAALGNDLGGRIQQPRGRLAETVAEMCLDNGVAECVITTADTQIRISRDDLPAIETVREKRADQLRPRKTDRPQPPPDRALKVEDSISASIMDEERAVARDLVGVSDEAIADLVRRRDGRIYTIVGYLRPPGADGNSVPDRDWEFRTQSGKAYIARGVDSERIGRTNQNLIVIRAEIVDRENGFAVLDVKDVIEPEEP